MTQNLSKNTKLILAKASQVSAGTTITTDPIDTQGYEGVMFFGTVATVNAGNYAKVRQGQAADMSDGADLEGTKVVPGTNGNSFLIDVLRPRERYVDCQIVRGGANTVVGDVYALLYGPHKMPTSQGATIDAEAHQGNAEGTA
jgi:hypothetical protein